MYCPKCGSKNPNNSKFCKKCGTPQSSQPISNNSHRSVIIGVIVFACIVGVITVNLITGKREVSRKMVAVERPRTTTTPHTTQTPSTSPGIMQKVELVPSYYINSSNKSSPKPTNTPDKFIIKTLPGRWKYIGQFSEGLCPVQDISNGLWGYVDASSKYVINPQYYMAYPFSEGLAAVQNANGTYDIIDKNNTIKLKTDFTDIRDRYTDFTYGDVVNHRGFRDGYLLGTGSNTAKLINKDGKPVDDNISISQRDIIIDGNMKLYESYSSRYICDELYNKLAEFTNSTRNKYYNSTYAVGYSVGKNKNLSLFNIKGEIVYDLSGLISNPNATYDISMTDDYIIVKRNIGNVTISALYNFKGELVFDYKYKEIYPINTNIYLVCDNGNNNYVIDSADNVLVSNIYSFFSSPVGFSHPEGMNGFLDDIRYIDAVKNTGLLQFTSKDKTVKIFNIQDKSVLTLKELGTAENYSEFLQAPKYFFNEVYWSWDIFSDYPYYSKPFVQIWSIDGAVQKLIACYYLYAGSQYDISGDFKGSVYGLLDIKPFFEYGIFPTKTNTGIAFNKLEKNQ